MIAIVDIEKHIKKGITEGYNQNLALKLAVSDFESKIVEYLLTVNISQELLKWNYNYEYQINLEYYAKDFYKYAFHLQREIRDENLPLSESVFEHPKTVLRSSHKPIGKPSGKIDLVITKKSPDILSSIESLIGIEVKGINQSISLVKNDIKRLAVAASNNDDVSNNSIVACYCVFLERLDKDNEILTNQEIQKRKDLCYNKWNDCVQKMKFSSINFSVEIFSIRESSYEEIKDFHEAQASEYSEVAADTGIVIGVMIKITKM